MKAISYTAKIISILTMAERESIMSICIDLYELKVISLRY